RHGDRPSSRVKDLVDIVVIALSETFDGDELAQAIANEARVRRLSLGESFSLPKEWGSGQAAQYAKLAEQTHLPEDVATMSGGLELAKQFLDPVLSGSESEMSWHSCGWTTTTH
ncbi:MAG: nucleotidyl transferase AbiEii/AbiGii toxin family protein, partial [Eggerthellaceae bacterium]|nr:nucleotidyl transferase AbiEii/AbiGii toxin family protein [Eggerthellaceae bacterium]